MERLRAAFDVFDADGSGALDAEEMRAVLSRPGGGKQMTDEEIKEVIADFDANGDGEIQFDEFIELWSAVFANEAEMEEEEDTVTGAASVPPVKQPRASQGRPPAQDSQRRGQTSARGKPPPPGNKSKREVGKKAKKGPSADGPALQTSAELLAMADAKQAEADRPLDRFSLLEGELAQISGMIGEALLAKPRPVKDIVRDWDVNKDGNISKASAGAGRPDPALARGTAKTCREDTPWCHAVAPRRDATARALSLAGRLALSLAHAHETCLLSLAGGAAPGGA